MHERAIWAQRSTSLSQRFVLARLIYPIINMKMTLNTTSDSMTGVLASAEVTDCATLLASSTGPMSPPSEERAECLPEMRADATCAGMHRRRRLLHQPHQRILAALALLQQLLRQDVIGALLAGKVAGRSPVGVAALGKRKPGRGLGEVERAKEAGVDLRWPQSRRRRFLDRRLRILQQLAMERRLSGDAVGLLQQVGGAAGVAAQHVRLLDVGGSSQHARHLCVAVHAGVDHFAERIAGAFAEGQPLGHRHAHELLPQLVAAHAALPQLLPLLARVDQRLAARPGVARLAPDMRSLRVGGCDRLVELLLDAGVDAHEVAVA